MGQEEEGGSDIVTGIDNKVEVIDIVTDIENEVEVTDIVTDIVDDIDHTVTVEEKEEIPCIPIISETVSKGKTEDVLHNRMNDETDLLLTDGPAQQVDLLTSELEEPAASSGEVENIPGRAGEIQTRKYFYQVIVLQTLT